jgi:hypothetical protein
VKKLKKANLEERERERERERNNSSPERLHPRAAFRGKALKFAEIRLFSTLTSLILTHFFKITSPFNEQTPFFPSVHCSLLPVL